MQAVCLTSELELLHSTQSSTRPTHMPLEAAPASSRGAGAGEGTSTSLPSVLLWIRRCT